MSVPAQSPTLLSGKVALVTGAGSGIGRAAALAFVRAGARVVLADFNVAAGTEAAQAIIDTGGQARFLQTDVTRESDVIARVQSALDAYGGLDCALNNAGIEGPQGRLADLTEADWDRVLDVNLKAIWRCLKHEIRHMASHGGGAIVNMASIYGLAGSAQTPAYSVSKHGVVGLTKSAAVG